MSVTHACPLCDFSREADHPTVLDPACPRCGGVLQSTSAEAAPAVAPSRLASLTRTRRFELLLTALVVLPILLAATKLGAGAAGPAGAIGCLALASLASFVALAPRR